MRRQWLFRLGLVAALLWLGGCQPMGDEPPPTEVIPELVIVTPTVGVPAILAPVVAGQYTVQPGDTLSGIAERFGVSEDAILAVNQDLERDRLFAGQVLAIPAAEPGAQ